METGAAVSPPPVPVNRWPTERTRGVSSCCGDGAVGPDRVSMTGSLRLS